jgi:hypothetical protein
MTVSLMSYTQETTLHGRRVLRGAELSVTGIRGRARFLCEVTTPDGKVWWDIITADERARSIRPDRVKTVHREVVSERKIR